MLASGLVGLRALSQVNTRAEDMVQLQRKIAAYRQLNHDTIGQLYSVASSLLKPEDRTLEATLRQLNQFGTTSTACSSSRKTRKNCSRACGWITRNSFGS